VDVAREDEQEGTTGQILERDGAIIGVGKPEARSGMADEGSHAASLIADESWCASGA